MAQNTVLNDKNFIALLGLIEKALKDPSRKEQLAMVVLCGIHWNKQRYDLLAKMIMDSKQSSRRLKGNLLVDLRGVIALLVPQILDLWLNLSY